MDRWDMFASFSCISASDPTLTLFGACTARAKPERSINPAYLEMDYQMQIQEEFEERSEILLKEFLKVGHHTLVSMCCLTFHLGKIDCIKIYFPS